MCLFTCYFYIIFVYADVKLGLKLLLVLVCVSDFKEHRFRKVIFPEKSLNVNSVLFSCGSEINEKGMDWGCCQFCIVNLWILLSVVCYSLTFFFHAVKWSQKLWQNRAFSKDMAVFVCVAKTAKLPGFEYSSFRL